jgi:uncharacterized membrane protein (UPF0127 family)
MQPRVDRVAFTVAVHAVVTATVLVGAAHLSATTGLGGDTHESATVTVRAANGDALGTVDVQVADTADERYTGLSDTEALAADEGMLFVFRTEGERAFVMRDMAFPLDIVFVAADGTITAIHEAPLPAPGTDESDLTRYRGRAKWVLEVNRNWTDRHGVTVGDRVLVNDTG